MRRFSSELGLRILKKWSHRPSPNLAQNFGQIPSRALGLAIFSELHLEVVAPRFKEIQVTREVDRETADLSLSLSPP